MKLATFNANSIRSREQILTDWLTEHDPDVLCIQETKVVDELFPSGPFEALGYQLAFRGQKSYNGVAIMSKETPQDVRFGFEEDPKVGARNPDWRSTVGSGCLK